MLIFLHDSLAWSSFMPILLHGNHDACVLVPAQQWIISVFCSRFRNVCSTGHEVFVKVCACEAPGYSGIHGFHDSKVSREEDIKVALVDLNRVSEHCES